MKKLLAFLPLFFLATFTIKAQQCGKKFKLKTEKIVTVQEDGSDGEEVPLVAEISVLKDSILINLTTGDGQTIQVNGKHTETVCKMNDDYTEGTIEYKTDVLMTRNDETRNEKMLFKIEAKGGKLKIYGVPESQPSDKICFVIKEREEVK